MTESERSVAVGSAAPEPRTNGHAGPPTAAHHRRLAADRAHRRRPRGALDPGHGVAADPAAAGGGAGAAHRGRRRGAVLGGALVLAAAAATALALALGDGAGAGNSTGAAVRERRPRRRRGLRARPTSPRTAPRSGACSPPACSGCSPAASPAAAGAVVNEYERQFRSQDTRGYELEDLEARGGRAGRASGAYRVKREGGDAIEGRIVFGVVRDRGQPRIASDRRHALGLSAQQARATRTRTVVPRRTSVPAAGSCSQTPRPFGTSGSRKPPPRSRSRPRPRRATRARRPRPRRRRGPGPSPAARA